MAAGLAIEHAEGASHQCSSVCLNNQCLHPLVSSWIEGGVQASVCIQAAEVLPRLPAQGGDVSSEQDLPVRLQSQDRNLIISVCRGVRRIELGIDTAVGIEPGDVGPRLPAELGEGPSHEDLRIWLDNDAVHERTIGTAAPRHAGMKRVINAAVGLKSCDVRPGRTANTAEITSHEDLAVRLHRDCSNGAIDVRIKAIVAVWPNTHGSTKAAISTLTMERIFAVIEA